MSAINEIKNTLSAADNEATESPYWLILDPSQNMRCDVHELASQITGPFFSREDAESFLAATRYNFSERAKVYCMSGYHSFKYKKFYRSLEQSDTPIPQGKPT